MEICGFIAHHPQTIFNRLKKQRGFQQPLLGSREITAKSGLSAMQRISVHYMETSVLPFILHSEDRLSMAHGIESRVPFLDHRLVEFCLSVPDEMKIKSGVRKRLLRESSKDLLPKTVYQRYEKIGFATPINEALNTKLKSLLANRARWGSFNLQQVPSLWRQVAFQQWWDLFIKA
jgi:asparagine synthetase B (glutamine-hydrolysing)